MAFDTLGLSPQLVRAVADQGYRDPTPIQRLSIPAVLDGRDIMARAQTGTGKTAGFALPLLQRLNESSPGRERGNVRALVLTPTRELAAQVRESLSVYGKYLPLRSAAVFGGVGFRPQVQTFRRGVEILVATPGRLLDHVGRRTVDLSRVEILVLDEADRMLDMGFIHDIRRILALLPRRRQNLLFSATLSAEIQDLAERLLVSPMRIEVPSSNPAADGVSHLVHPVDRGRKAALLSFLIGSRDWRQVLVFTRTKRGADRLTRQLVRDGIRTTAIHSDKNQGARTKALAQFRRGAVRVLVATDIAARGLDIERLPHVVNFDLPHVPEDYVHRIGRTGRAGEKGDAVSLVSTEERSLLRGIERLIQQDVPKLVVSGFEPDPARDVVPHPDRSRSRGAKGLRGRRAADRHARSRRYRRKGERDMGESGERGRPPRNRRNFS